MPENHDSHVRKWEIERLRVGLIERVDEKPKTRTRYGRYGVRINHCNRCEAEIAGTKVFRVQGGYRTYGKLGIDLALQQFLCPNCEKDFLEIWKKFARGERTSDEPAEREIIELDRVATDPGPQN